MRSTQQQPTVPAIRQRQNAENRMLVFYSPDSLERLANAQTFFIFMDGTFSVAPHPFKQLYTIRVPFKDVTGTVCILAVVVLEELLVVVVYSSGNLTSAWVAGTGGVGRWYRIVRLGFSSRGSEA
jgi:hypothetical protein